MAKAGDGAAAVDHVAHPARRRGRIADLEQGLQGSFAGASLTGAAQGGQPADHGVVGIGEAGGDHHRCEGGSVQPVGGVQHPQQVEHPALLVGRCPAGERLERGCREALRRIGHPWGSRPSEPDHGGGERGNLADDAQLPPVTPAAEVVVDVELVAAERGDAGPESSRRVGRPCEVRDESDHLVRERAAVAQVAAELGEPVGVVIGGRAGDQQERDLLEVRVGGERVDRHPPVGEGGRSTGRARRREWIRR